ncbi:hypothetical protein PC9H_005910 [Pleurotus ostreatus]|uniref:Cytochrome P450 n=1 Tax=Pleurotus ostreatus TaxID=5322 RepID=A0A8H6ZV81_PLEOS|nr:uncharacterized protein PC9H_005910 [Pleurotus ostreatus]KAF7430208.1 hypothetical protein PC9H_005910 [Pleurotus ostreatus]
MGVELSTLNMPPWRGAGYFGRKYRQTLPLPPGPKQYPIVGNLNLPNKDQWIVYDRIAKEHNSDIIHIRTFGSSLIVLNSFAAAVDLLDRRSRISSSRPAATMLYDLMGWKSMFSIQPYGQEWRDRRRVFWQEFHPEHGQRHHRPIQLHYSRELVRRLYDSPLEFQAHIRHTIGASIISIAYGLDVQGKDDPYITIANNALEYLDISFAGTFMVDVFPILRHVPRWMPGAGFRATGERATHALNLSIEVPYLQTLKSLTEGHGESTFVHRALSRGEIPSGGQEERVIKESVAAAYIGANETTPFPLTIFFAIMAHNLDVQTKAQRELDQYLDHRFPDFEDQPHLPYISAVMLETLRWEPMTPLGLAHGLISDDKFRGYYLPKGSIVFYNVWAILRDETIFPEPDKFNPSRFLKDGLIDTQLKDRVMSSFGFGRRHVVSILCLYQPHVRKYLRICPGRYFAMDTLWLSMASILSVYTIGKPVDESGRKVDIALKYKAGLNRFIARFAFFLCADESPYIGTYSRSNARSSLVLAKLRNSFLICLGFDFATVSTVSLGVH